MESRRVAYATDVLDGSEREIDIVAELEGGMYPFRIGVEVRDRGRRADVEWVDGAIGKLGDVGLDKKVLWSAKGFTPRALNRAKAHNIETVTPGDAKDAPWAKFAQQIVGGSVHLLKPTLTIPTVDVTLADGRKERWPVTAGTLLRTEDGSGGLYVQQVIEFVSSQPGFSDALFDVVEKGHTDVHGVFHLPKPLVAVGPAEEIGTLTSITIGIALRHERKPLITRSVLHQDKVTTIAEAHLLGGEWRTVIREGKDGMRSITAVHDVDSTTSDDSPRRSPKSRKRSSFIKKRRK